VYVAKFRDSGLWRLDLLHPEKGFDSANLPASTFDEHTPDYAPDGKRLAFASTRTGTEEIWISDVDGTNARQMTTMGGPLCANPRWSPDGRHIAFDAIKDGERDIFLIDVRTAEVRRLTTGADREHDPRWRHSTSGMVGNRGVARRTLAARLGHQRAGDRPDGRGAAAVTNTQAAASGYRVRE